MKSTSLSHAIKLLSAKIKEDAVTLIVLTDYIAKALGLLNESYPRVFKR